MIRGTSWGVGRGLDGREASRLATQRALDRLGSGRPVLAIVFFSQEFDPEDVLAGIVSLLGGTPVWGCSTVAPFIGEGEQTHSVVVAILSGNELKAQVYWYPDFAHYSKETARQIGQLADQISPANGLLIAADGVSGDIEAITARLDQVHFPVVGCLSEGNYQTGRTTQLGGNQGGAGGLSALLLGGRFRLNAGMGHGWQSVGVKLPVDRSRGVWIHTLGGVSAAEAFSRVFGYPTRQWAYLPLSRLIRLYALGLEDERKPGRRVLRSPLHAEVNGSFRMNTHVPDGKVAELMIGNLDECLNVTRRVTLQAMDGLGKARPLLVICFVDLAWRMLFGSRAGQFIQVVKEIAAEIPVIGAYTLGQILGNTGDIVLDNQNLLVVVLGESLD